MTDIKNKHGIQWSTAEDVITKEIHVFPTFERHDLDSDCWCAPIKQADIMSKFTVYQHNSKHDAN